MTLVADVKARLLDQVDALADRVQEAADLAELVRRKVMPQKTPAAFVLPLALDARPGDAATGLFRQGVTETIAVILYVEALGDPKAQKALGTIDTLRDAVLAAIAGWAPAGEVGVFEVRRGRLVSVTAGAVIYQLDFAIFDQLRIIST